MISFTGTQIELTVPAGTNHDVWTAGNRSLRIMQPALDENMEIEVKFESEPSQAYQLQGLLIEQDSDNYLRVDFYSDNTNLRMFAARFEGGVPTVITNETITGGTALFLRLTRQGDAWTYQYSDDGSNWTGAGNFTYGLSVSAVGVFVGNGGGNPAYTATVDYFFNTWNPIVPEDGPRTVTVV